MNQIPVVETLQGEQQVQQERPDLWLRYLSVLHHVALQAAVAQFHLHVQLVVLLPGLVHCDAVLVLGELFVALHLLQALSAVLLAAEVLLRLLHRVQLSILLRPHLEHLPETAFADLADDLEALLKVRFGQLLAVDGGQLGCEYVVPEGDRLRGGGGQVANATEVGVQFGGFLAGIRPVQLEGRGAG